MNMCQCSRPTQNLICNICLDTDTHSLRNLLIDIPELLAELGTTTAKQDVTNHTAGTGHAYGSRPPINHDSYMLEVELQHLLLVMWLATGHEGTYSSALEAVHAVLGRFDRLATYQGVQSLKTQLTDAKARAERLIVGSTTRVIVGECECGTTLTADEDQQETTCGTCSQVYEVDAYRRDRVLSALGAEDRLYRAAEAVRLLNRNGVRVTTKDLENWAKHQHITPADTDSKGRKLYALHTIYAHTKTA
ncbi:hypothetical protein [Arthrobacter russicus]|uniref:Uncharacterized protein n=1 Tax=Arthrobacter russicus TaxID=172040 RepID=A0ABU1J901_9MICC|nr:hypothetical protein [Arthrobacter russicus]MDR6268901.1 hypothetical protein [Arthrobacter russicus]